MDCVLALSGVIIFYEYLKILHVVKSKQIIDIKMLHSLLSTIMWVGLSHTHTNQCLCLQLVVQWLKSANDTLILTSGDNHQMLAVQLKPLKLDNKCSSNYQ